MGVGSFGENLQFRPHSNITVRKLRFCPPGLRQKFQYLWLCLLAAVWAIRWRPAWIYISDSITCPIGLLLSLLPGSRIIYNEHDSPNPEQKAATVFMRLALWARRRLAARARICILPNEQRRELFIAAGGVAR